jgi:aminomethyltransferase
MLDSPYPSVTAGPPRPSRVISAGLAPGRERHEVPGGGAILLRLGPGDRVAVVDAEGGQRCELVAADLGGRTDGGLLGLHASAEPLGMRALLAGPGAGDGLGRLRAGLLRRGIDLGRARAVALFGTESRAGARAEFKVQGEGHLVVAAPAAAMAPDAQDTATPLVVTIDRARPREVLGHDLPEPLADPLMDLRVRSATAEAFLVRAGDYIQVIDVDGRQCTDFQAFDARKLDRGIEHPIDVTTSRTLMGHDFSRPGLHSKYYDQEMVPLVEVVQDTVGRHDAFALACSAKYYDDIGYPGHANCSGNFNRALAPMASPRGPAGWRSTCSSTPRSTHRDASSRTSPGRAPGTTCCSARSPTSSA